MRLDVDLCVNGVVQVSVIEFVGVCQPADGGTQLRVVRHLEGGFVGRHYSGP